MFPSNIIFAFGGDRGTTSAQALQTGEKLRRLLLDEDVQVISSFELNQIATLTYHESSIADGDDLCELVFEVLTSVLSKPAQHTPLTLQKALVVAQHVLIFGAEKVINEAMVLGKHVDALQQYNTVLIAQQQQTATSLFLKIKGGGVDKGGPVRERAVQVNALLSDRNKLAFERNSQADPNSLVPVGDGRAAFASDEVRLYALKKKMEHQHMIQIKSNLAKADNGFGSGYNSRDGKAVVGAAHGLDEMIRVAQEKEKRAKMKFTDDPAAAAAAAAAAPKQSLYQQDGFSSYVAPSLGGGDPMSFPMGYPPETAAGDLLSMDDTAAAVAQQQTGAAEVDLLGFGGGESAVPPSSPYGHDLLAGSEVATDGAAASTATAPADIWSTGDLLGSMSISDGGPTTTATTAMAGGASNSVQPQQPQNDLLGTSSQGVSDQHPVSPPPQPPTSVSNEQRAQKRPIMGGMSMASGGGDDPFAALDALSPPPSVESSAQAKVAPAGAVAAGPLISTTSAAPGNGAPSREGATAAAPAAATAAQNRILGGLANSITSAVTGFSMGRNASSSKNVEIKITDSINSGSGAGPYDGGYQVNSATSSSVPWAAAAMDNAAPQPFYAPTGGGSLKVSESQIPQTWSGADGGDDDENGFVMGGSAGAGLEPIGEAPAAPPPPPPAFY